MEMIVKQVSKTKLLLALLAFTFLTSNCGKRSNNQFAKVEIVPEEPIVINADLELGDLTCGKPWYYARYKITNGSDQPIVFVAVKSEITGFKDGKITTATVDVTDLDLPYLLIVDAKQGETDAVDSRGIYVCGLPEADGLTYTVTSEAIGWFGELDNAVSRFSKINAFGVH